MSRKFLEFVLLWDDIKLIYRKEPDCKLFSQVFVFVEAFRECFKRVRWDQSCINVWGIIIVLFTCVL